MTLGARLLPGAPFLECRMDVLINAANLLYVVAYFTTDMLRLRLLTTVASLCIAAYFANQPVPLVNVVAWNLFFFGLNLMQITRLLARQRRSAAT